MKRTDTKKALAGKNATELQTELEALLKEQFGLRMQVATQQLTNTSKLKDVRRGIARVRTLQGQAARASTTSAEATPAGGTAIRGGKSTRRSTKTATTRSARG